MSEYLDPLFIPVETAIRVEWERRQRLRVRTPPEQHVAALARAAVLAVRAELDGEEPYPNPERHEVTRAHRMVRELTRDEEAVIATPRRPAYLPAWARRRDCPEPGCWGKRHEGDHWNGLGRWSTDGRARTWTVG